METNKNPIIKWSHGGESGHTYASYLCLTRSEWPETLYIMSDATSPHGQCTFVFHKDGETHLPETGGLHAVHYVSDDIELTVFND